MGYDFTVAIPSGILLIHSLGSLILMKLSTLRYQIGCHLDGTVHSGIESTENYQYFLMTSCSSPSRSNRSLSRPRCGELL
jgi:hypothetical protein